MSKNLPNKFKAFQTRIFIVSKFPDHYLAKLNILYYKYLLIIFNFLKENI